MSMILYLIALDDANIRRLLVHPALAWGVIAPDESEPSEQSVPALQLSDDEGRTVDLDKAWHGIHYLLTGHAAGRGLLSFLVDGGRTIDDIDVGYGPARVFTAEETKAINEALHNVSNQALESNFNPRDMLKQGIYPEIWYPMTETDDTLSYLMNYVQVLRSFLSQVIDKKYGFVLYLS